MELTDFVLVLLSVVAFSQATHFRGAIFMWEPTGNPHEVRVTYSIFWRRDSTGGGSCDAQTVSSGVTIGGGEGQLQCFFGCNASSIAPIEYHCTDYNVLENWSTGRMTRIVTITNGSHFEIGFTGGDWISSLRYGADSSWMLKTVGSLALRRDTGRINSSPTADIAPIVRLQSGCNHTISLLVNDADRDIIRCRLASRNGPYGDECLGVCNGCPHCILEEKTCQVHYNAIYGTGWFALAIQIEDFIDSSSTRPLSSVPLQFLLHVESSSSSCHNGPHFVGPTPPNRACYGLSVHDNFEAQIVARLDRNSMNSNTQITEIETVSPLGMTKSPLFRVDNSSTDWMVNVTWSQSFNSSANNDFCFTAYDSTGGRSETRCLNIISGVKPPSFIHGSLKNRYLGGSQIEWTISVDEPISRPTRAVYIRLFNSNGTELEVLDATNYNEVLFPRQANTTISFITSANLPPDEDYYFIFDQGVVKGETYCGVENPSDTDKYDWKVHLYRHTPVRLVNGTTKYEGRIEVYYQGSWGTVCDDSFNEADAEVICRMLGYTWDDRSNISVYSSAHYGYGSGIIIIDDLDCQGNEMDVAYCTSSPWLSNNCGHSEDVGIDCGFPIRLVNGNTSWSGRLEIFNNSRWETVCDNGFSTTNARIVCTSLGFNFSGNPTIYTSYVYGSGYGHIADSVWSCNGNEQELFDCPSRPRYYYDYCSHSNDVWLSCADTRVPIRLTNGPNKYAGRVEVYHNNEWGTVCDDNFNINAARVICSMLGFNATRYPEIHNSAYYGQGYGPIMLDGFSCNGGEQSILECLRVPWYQNDCGHGEDAGVDCMGHTQSTYFPYWITDYTTEDYVRVRLVNGSRYYEGRVEVYYRGQWGTVCDDSFDSDDAYVICKMVGYSYNRYPLVHGSAFYGQGSGRIIVDELRCSGYESSIENCGSNPWLTHDCSHSEDVGIDCQSTRGTPSYTHWTTPYWTVSSRSYVRVRLVNGTSSYDGRVEVFYGGQWGTICDDSFDSNDAYVVCKMIGYSLNRYPAVRGNAYYGEGSGRITVDDLGCSGYESTIESCSSRPWLSHNCNHNEDVGVDCYAQTTLRPSTGYYRWTTWYYTTRRYFRLEDAIHVGCNEYGWDIWVDMNLLRTEFPSIRASDVYLGKNLCTGMDYGSSLLFHQGLRECLTSETISGQHIIYRNELVYAIHDPNHPFIIRRYNWTVQVECDVSRNMTAVGHLHHDFSNTTAHHVSGMSNYTVQMSFYKDSNFMVPIPGNPLRVAVGTPVYVKVFTAALDWNVKMVVHDCFTKPTPNSPDSTKYAIIRNGCEVDTNTHIITQSTHETKFVFEDFEYTSNHEGIYLFCHATFCGSSDYASHCQQQCHS